MERNGYGLLFLVSGAGREIGIPQTRILLFLKRRNAVILLENRLCAYRNSPYHNKLVHLCFQSLPSSNHFGLVEIPGIFVRKI